MKRLFLVRHAKAVPGGPEIEDFDRALTVRGMHDAAAVARYLRKSDYVPDLVWSSTAARAAQTTQLFVAELEREPRTLFRDALYLAGAEAIVALVRACPRDAQALMIVGHNPGLEEAAGLLAREPVRGKERARRDVLEEKFPTGAVATLDFDVARWRQIEPDTGKLVDFVRPRDL